MTGGPSVALLWLSCLLLVASPARSGSCPAGRSSVQVEPESEVVVGAVLDLHEPGSGVLGCGAPSAAGLHYYEALRWSLRRLNQGDSFVPGITFGLQAYDSCGHSELAIQYMAELFPVLKTGAATCQSFKEDVSKMLGMVDASGLSKAPRVSDAISKYLVPVIPLNQATAVPPEQLAKALAEVVHDMNWERVAILHADDEYSLYVTKVFGQISFTGFPCITAMKPFSGSGSSLRKTVSSLTGKLQDGTGVIVVAQGEPLKGILEELNNSPELFRLQWLFSWLPPIEQLQEAMRGAQMKNIYSLSPYPHRVAEFEEYWAKLQDVASSADDGDYWFLDYAAYKKRCRVAGHQGKSYGHTVSCENLIVKESPMEQLMRTARFIPAMHSVFTFAHAYRRAWKERCLGIAGMCPALRAMTKKEFVEQYLEPLHFEHLPESRSPEEVRGQKTNQTARGEIDSIQMALNVYYLDQNQDLQFKQVFSYDSQEAKVLDNEFHHQPSTCPRKGCNNCISIRQSRLDSTDYDISSSEDFVTVARSEDVLIPILLPIHEASDNPMECSNAINAKAVQELEAALWTIDQINEDPQYLQGVQLGAVAIDTCSSPLTLTQRLSNFLMEMQQKSPDEFTSSLAVISSGSSGELLSASAVLSPLNITIVSSSDAIRSDQMRDNLLQTALPIETKVEAVVQTLDYLGWSYVSVLYDSEGQNLQLLSLFKKYADEKRICIAAELSVANLDQVEVDFVITHLIEARRKGAEVIMLWTGEVTTSIFLEALRRAINARLVTATDFVIICNGEWVTDLNSFRGFDNQTIGAITLKPEQGVVNDFEAYYQRLQPVRNRRNPWFAEIHGGDHPCYGSDCDNAPALMYQSTVNVIQAVLAISAGLARLRNDVCQSKPGLCPEMMQQPNIRHLVHKYIHETASSRLDFKGEMFTFTKSGYGNIPINILSFRKGVSNTLTHQKAGTYKDHRVELTTSVIYSAVGEELALDEVVSQCSIECSTCGKKSPDFIVLDSKDELYLAATLSVHESSDFPLTCSSSVTAQNMQTMEAFLWAVDQINSSPQLLPDVHLGAIIFDTCSSKERAARDVSNFLSEPPKVHHSKNLPRISQVMGFISNQDDDVVDTVVSVTSPLNILTIATDITSTKFNNIDKYPYLLRTSLPNDVISEGLIELLKHFRWEYVSLVYSDDMWKHENLFQAFKEKADVRGVELAATEKIPSGAQEGAIMGILNKLKAAKEKGAKVVLLLLSREDMKNFFAAITKLQELRRLSPGDFLWIGVDNLETFHKYADVSLGAIMLKPTASAVMPFKQHFESLHLANNTRNPWYREFWEQMTGCRGVDCFRQSSVPRPPYIQNPAVPAIINSVLSVGVALENLRFRLCPGTERGLCRALLQEPALRERLVNVTRSSSFMGVHGELFKFTKRNFAAGTLDIFNFVQVGNNARAFVEAGRFSPDEGLLLNNSKVRAYDSSGSEVSLYSVKSRCTDVDSCGASPTDGDVSLMEIVPKREFAISAILPIHRKGRTFFDCGELRDDHIFQNLVAFSYAVHKINADDTLLPNINLGGIAFDFCSRRQRAEEQMYGYFSKDKVHRSNAKISPKSVIASLTFDENVAKDLAPILEASEVVQVAAPSDQKYFSQENDLLYTVPSSAVQIQVLLSLLKKYNWNYVSLLYSNTEFGRSSYYQFSKAAKVEDICLADILMIEPDSSPDSISSVFDSEIVSPDSKIIILLVDNTNIINNTIEAAKRSAILHKYVWVTTNSWNADSTYVNNLYNSRANIISVQLEDRDVPEFLQYFTNMSPHRHEPIPNSWFDEWWQHHFRCRLADSSNVQNQYAKLCTGQEHINQMTQDKHVYHTTKVVEAIAKGLHRYLSQHCPLGLSAASIEDCGPEAKQELKKEFTRIISGNDPDCEECGPLGTMFGYDVFQWKSQEDGTNVYVKIGNWKDGVLTLDEDLQWSPSGEIVQSTCQENCGKCAEQLGTRMNLADMRHAVFQNFKEVWGIAVSSLSVLGMVLVIICALYFLMSFPVTVGTTVLGYMILFGLFLLYAVNFAFIISPTEGTCGVRRFGLGLAYAIIFSGMLVKVMNTWRIMGYNGSRMLNDGTRLSSPAGLLVIAVGLVIIQVVLSSAWLILMPPRIGAYEMVWRCAPPATFEEGLIVSLVYVMLLLAITTLFAILTWQCQDNNRESRWILACSTMVAVIWLAWTILSTQVSPHHRDLTIAAANLTNATIIMVCLYLRKVYLYSKLTRQAKDQDLKAHLQPGSYPHSAYGSSQRSGPFSTLTPVLYGSQASLNGKKLYNGPSSRVELINCPEDNKSDSSGSVQVQAADLYPLDMYDGGSQFQPISSLFGSNHTLVLDDTITFGR